MMEGPDVPAPLPLPACPHCGQEVREGARYCPHCGKPAQAGVPPTRRAVVSVTKVMREVRGSTIPVSRTILFYLVWLCSGVGGALFAQAGNLVPVILGIEIFDAVFTFGWVAYLRRDVLRLYARVLCGAGHYVVALLAAYPVALILHLFVEWLTRTFNLDPESISRDFLQEGYGWSVIFLAVCVQPAVIEELAFRGVIQTTLTDLMKPAEAIIVSAIAFSIMHFSLVMFLPFVLMGAYFGWLRQRSGSLYPSMLAHFLHNFLVTLHEHTPIFPA